MPAPCSTARPIVVLGAARSGTKFLRAVIASSDSVAATPYDMNYVWRFGNEACPHDAFTADMATPRSVRFIQRQLARAAGLQANDPRALVEKTVSNPLRLAFVRRVLPDARFVHLIRDGRDVVESSMRCWREPPRGGYVMKKLACYPWRACLPYAAKHALRTAGRALGVTPAVASWGPRYQGIDRDVRDESLAYVCSRQWQQSVDGLADMRDHLGEGDLYELRYEQLARRPAQTALALAEWLNLPDAPRVARYAADSASASSLGGFRRLGEVDQRTVLQVLAPTLQRWGYADPPAAPQAA